MDNSNYAQLLADYLSICNQALKKNSDHFPFGQVLKGIQQKDQGKTVEIHIVDDCFTPNFRIKIANDKIAFSTCAGKNGCCRSCVKHQWHVPCSYLKNVTQNPQTYIDNPALLNWEWLQSDEMDHLSLQGKPDEHAEQL